MTRISFVRQNGTAEELKGRDRVGGRVFEVRLRSFHRITGTAKILGPAGAED
jgi:hypothetical protein